MTTSHASTEPHDSDLHDLVDQLLAGELSTEDRSKLNDLLRSDERDLARRAAVGFCPRSSQRRAAADGGREP